MYIDTPTTNIAALFLLLLAVPWVVGMLYTRFLPEERQGCLLSWIAGYIILWGLFEMIALPLIFQRKSLSLLCIIYGGTICLLAVATLVLSWRDLARMVRGSAASMKGMSPVGLGNLLLILGQAYMYAKYMHIDEDDAFYVGAASTAVATDTIFSVNPYTGAEYGNLPSRYVLSPFFSFVAFLSRVSRVHPAITAHVVLAVILVLVSYSVYALVAKKLFPDNRKYAEYFLFFLILVLMFSGYTVYTQGMFALVRIWQGKAVFCGILAPMVCLMAIQLFSGQAAAADWCLTFLLMCACCMVSSMGIMLGAIMLGTFGLVYTARERKLKPLVYTALCCLPNLVCAGIYLLVR